MKRIPLIILFGSLLAASGAFATTYVRVEKDGTKTYSDRPIPGGHPIELQSAQAYTAVPAPAPSESASRQSLLNQDEDFRYESCELTPKQDTTFTNPGAVGIAVTLTPGLRPTDVVQLKVDGATVGTTTTTTYTMSPVYRGSHTVSVLITNRNGKPLCNATATFHVFKPSLNSPARR